MRRSRVLLIATCAAAVLLLAACGTSGEPTSFDDTVEENFTKGCELAAESDPAIRPAAQQYCTCAWGRLVAEVGFDDFKALDDDIRDDPANITDDSAGDDDTADPAAGPALVAIMADCRAQHSRG